MNVFAVMYKTVPFFTSHWHHHWSVIRIRLFARYNKCTDICLVSTSTTHNTPTYIIYLYIYDTVTTRLDILYKQTVQGIQQTADYTYHSTETHTALWHAVGYSWRLEANRANGNRKLNLMQMWLICSDLCVALTYFLKCCSVSRLVQAF